MSKINIAFFGTSELSERVLSAIYTAKYNIRLVITKPDKLRGRGKKLLPTPVKQFALDKGIPVIDSDKISVAIIDELKKFNIGLSIVVAFGQILPKEVIDHPILGSLNLHASLLPELRGASPIQSAILFGLKKTGITLQKMKYKMDSGDILAQKEIEIPEDWGAEDLLNKIMKEAPTFLVENLGLYIEGRLKPIPQDESKATYCHILKKSDGLVNWNNDAEEIVRKIMAFNTWPVCYTYIKSKILRLYRASIYSNVSLDKNDVIYPGLIFDIDRKQGILVKAGKGAVAIRELQLQNKKRMNFLDFANGYRNLKGVVLKDKIS